MALGNERGLALVTVLWTVAFLAVIASSFLASARNELHLGHNLVSLAQARALADAGVNRAILSLLEPAVARRWRGDGRLYTFDLDGHQIRVAVRDEGGKIDLNKAGRALLAGLFASVGVPPAQADSLADAVLDWRDTDDFRQPHGAERDDYRTAGYDYGPTNRPFESIEEVQLVIGMTPAIYDAIAPSVTVFSRRDGIDPTVAAPAVLAAVPGLEPAAAAAILAARNQTEEERATPARIPIYGVPTSPYFSRSPGDVFTVHAEARLADGTAFAREAVIRLTGDPDTPYLVHRWNRGARDGAPFDSRPSDRGSG